MNLRPGPPAHANLPVRQLSMADLSACVELAADRDWPPEEHKWRLLFRVGEVYGVDDPAGGLAGVVVLTRYGQELAAVGMMVVASRYGHQGLGRRLMSHLLSRAGGAVVYLTATSAGRPLYQKVGFRAIDTMAMHLGEFRPGSAAAPPVPVIPPAGSSARVPSGPSLSPPRAASPADIGPIAALDRGAFGADRGRVLAELFSFGEQVILMQDGEAIIGYASAWRNADVLVIGPVVAADPRLARMMITTIAADAAWPVRLDILGRHSGLAAWATAHGLVPRGTTTLMVHGGDLPGDRDQLFAPVSVAIG